jgi:hypothetical protein
MSCLSNASGPPNTHHQGGILLLIVAVSAPEKLVAALREQHAVAFIVFATMLTAVPPWHLRIRFVVAEELQLRAQ